MVRKLSVLMILTLAGSGALNAQTAPEAPKAPPVPTWNFQFESGSYLGVETANVTRENFGKYGLTEVRGVAVEKVVENSPAAKAGLQAGDVIVKFAGEAVTSARKLTRLVAEVAPDHRARVTIWRAGAERELEVTIGKRSAAEFFNGGLQMENLPGLPEGFKMPPVQIAPDGDADAFVWKNDGGNAFFFGSNRQIGVSVSTLTRQLGDYFGVAEGKGLLVNHVRENSPAARAGLKAGDVIVEADGREIKSNADLVRALNEKKDGDVNLTILREKKRQTIKVTPEAVKGRELAPLMEGRLRNAPRALSLPVL